MLALLVVMGSITKRAQMPFSAWLPAAMVAPTPVSALVHSSTLVTAGVYVLFRYGDILGEELLCALSVVSIMTVLIAGASALYEMDLKKVVALSTLRQVGVMMFAISLDCKMLAVFHLVNHAFIKALLFLCVGSVIYHRGGNQDGRLFSGMWYKLPVTRRWLAVRLLSLAGLPFLSGFYSKDLIIEARLRMNLRWLSVVCVYLSVVLTSRYCGRMAFLLLLSEDKEVLRCYEESSLYLLLPMTLLGINAIFGGFVLQRMVRPFSCYCYVGGIEKKIVLFCVLVGVFCAFFALGNFNGVYQLKSFGWGLFLERFLKKI